MLGAEEQTPLEPSQAQGWPENLHVSVGPIVAWGWWPQPWGMPGKWDLDKGHKGRSMLTCVTLRNFL